MRKLKTHELNRITTEEFKKLDKRPVLIILDNIRSMHNIGAIFRTADAFRLEAIHLCGITATPPHREIQRTALGATETVPWKYFSDTVESVKRLKQLGYHIVAVEQTDRSAMLQDYVAVRHSKTAVVFGNEISGVSDQVLKLADIAVEVPQFGTKHSLNVSVTAGIVIWHLFLQFPG
ncbi:MAG: RNA methyltransferase [Bacteroidales bacterium]|nr:RNA methyltransferase [Bacteroidales bacterium]